MQTERRTRRKAIKTCLECNRRKQKCNREKPCNNCTSRGVGHLCVYSDAVSNLASGSGHRAPGRRRSSVLDYGEDNITSSYESDATELAWATDGQIRGSKSSQISAEGLYFSPPSREQPQLRRAWPEKAISDFLVKMFLNEVNRTFESVIDPSFQSKYDRWCERRESKDAGHSPFAVDDELGDDFEILVLRVCLLSIQSLPCPGYPAFGVLNTHLNQLENWFCSLADELEASQKQERKPSIVAVQHKLCHVCYLIKYAKVRACWSALNSAIKEAHETGLHRRDDNAAVDDLEMELRRQIFWNLYVWDRYMCVYFGFWPLIPEGYFDVELPRDLFRPLTTTPGSVTTFTDRVYHVKIARYITAFTSPPSWKADRHNASLVAEFAQQFQVLVVDQLPSIYWLDNPDLRLDTVEPAIPRKRQFLHLAIYHTKASLYRAFADPFNRLHAETNTPPKHTPDLLALSHRRAYMDAICKAISCLVQLFASTTEKSGSAAEKLFLLPVWLIDALACLGVCFLSIQADERRLANQGLQISPDQDLKCCLVTFLNTFDILRRGASRSAFVKKGLEALETLYQIVYTSPCRELLLKSNDESEMATLGAFSVRETEGTNFQLEHALVSLHAQEGPSPPTSDSLPLPEWLPSFLEKPDRAWIFQQKSFFSDLLS